MAGKGKPYELFGSYLLFKKLESDALSDSWRAGEIVDGAIQNTVVVRRFTGGDPQAMRQAAEHARAVVSGASGTTILRGQKIGFVGGVPYLAHEYPGGRSLRTIVDKGRAANHPLPIDQALAIVEKLAISVETLSNMRYQGAKVTHGALIPQFVWVNDEGEIRTAGQQFGRGIVASLRQPEVGKELSGYFAPEVKMSDGAKSSDVYSLGAILYLLLTGQEPPDSTVAAVVGQAIQKATLAGRDEPIPADIRPILEKSLHVDPAQRYAGATDLRQALDKLLNAGEYSPTTFNLAFYLNTLLRKEMEVEQHERQSEAAVEVAPYLQATAAPAASAAPARTETPVTQSHAPVMFGSHAEPPKKSRMPLIAAALFLVAGGIVAAVFTMNRGEEPPSQSAAAVPPQAAPSTATTAPIEPIVAAVDTAGSTAPTATATTTAIADEAARQKAIEEAVNKRLQQELMKLQEEYNRDLQKRRVMEPSAVPAAAAARPTPAREEPTLSAAQLDAQRRQQQAPVQQATATQAPVPAAQAPAPSEPAPSVATQQPAAPSIQEGDVVAYNDLDRIPELRSPVRPVYPPAALKRRAEGTVLVTALISETGRVVDVKILRGDTTRSGFDDAAVRAVRAALFSTPMKNGKRVKTWKPMPVVFKLQ